MKKKYLLLLVSILLTLPSVARDFQYNYEGRTLIYTVIDEDAKTCKTKDGEKSNVPGNNISGNLIIPSIAKDEQDTSYTVVELGNFAFSENNKLTAVVIPNSVQIIGENAFKSCPYLTSIEIPNSVITIGASAFSSCDQLKSMIIGESVETIGEEAFSGCAKLPSIDLPQSVLSIGAKAFYGCKGLTSVIIPHSVKEIGSSAFVGCDELASVTVGESVETIGEEAFSGCAKLISIGIPNSVLSIGAKAFYGCKGLTSVTFGESVETIGDEAFSGCSGLTSVIIPNSVVTIGRSAFCNCSGLTSAIIGTSVTQIGSQAFENCKSLWKGAHPNTIENPFPRSPFDRDYTIVDYDPVGAIIENGWIFGPDKTSILFAPLDLKGDYKLPTTVISIGNYAFGSCSGLTSVIIPPSVTSIGVGAFEYCWSMTSVIIPPSVTSIGVGAFWNCSGLTSVIIPPSVKEIEINAFWKCTGLIKSAYPNTISNPFDWQGINVSYEPEGAIIEDGWIYGSDKSEIRFAPYDLEGEYTIPKTVTSIGNRAFQGCSSLTSVITLSAIPAVMPDNAFDGLYDDVKLYVPQEWASKYLTTAWALFRNLGLAGTEQTLNTYSDGVLNYRLIPAVNTDDKNRAVIISGDYSGEIAVPERFTDDSDSANPTRYYVDAIGYKAFSKSKISKIDFNSRIDLKLIGQFAFEECKNLTEISLPATVETIDDYAFYNTDNLKAVELNEGLKSIGAYAFASKDKRNSNNNPIFIPASVTSIDTDAFYGFTCSEVQINDLEAWCKIDFASISANPLYHANKLVLNEQTLSELSVPKGIMAIKPYAFSNCSSLNTVALTNEVKVIGLSAFSNCAALESVKIGKSVTEIDNYAFYNNVKLSSLDLGDRIEKIGEYAFQSCVSLPEVEIPNSVKSIYDYAFSKCSSLESVKIGNSLTEICDYTFWNDTKLNSVILGNAVESIGEKAFYDCNRLNELTIPASVTTIGKEAIPSTSIILSDGIVPIKLAEKAFYNDITTMYWGRPINENWDLKTSKLDTLVIGNTVKEIPAGSFSKCAALSSLKLGSGLKAIGDEAFKGCSKLEEVIVPPAVETIGASAFADNSKLASIIMGHSVATIGEKAFDGCPAKTVSITAQTPPTAPNNTFSTYSGNLYLQGEAAVDAYYDAYTCWDRFNGYIMIEATGIDMDTKPISGNAGDTFQLTATLMPENVTLPQVFWRSTNPEIATVDENGVVTLQANLSEVLTRADEGEDATCKIIAESLYADGPVVEVTVFNSDFTDVEEIMEDVVNSDIDYNAPVEVYNLSGMKVANTTNGLAKGIYIVRQGKVAKKIAIK